VVKERLTMPGQMPSSWMRPKRSTVVVLLLAVVVADAFLLLSSPDAGTLDARLAYTPAGAREFLGGLDDSARAVYRLVASVDFAFIVVYTTALVMWVRFLRNRAALPAKAHPILAVVPGLFDLAETGSIFAMLSDPAGAPAVLAWIAAIATPLKWLTGLGVFALVVWGEVRWIRFKRARRRLAARKR
jgi:hypothetical protein